MKKNHRYELKFVLDEGGYAEAMQWMHIFTGTKKMYPGRHVNSLYLDDAQYQSARDNLTGVSDRYKIRLRWYGEDDQISDPVMEIKIREGRLGYKRSYPLGKLSNNLLDMELKDIVSMMKDKIDDRALAIKIFSDYISPTLQIRYFREYYECFNGLRITIDDNINFYYASPHGKLVGSIAKLYPYRVMELKFNPDLKNEVARMLKPLHLTPKRHSKYLVGLASFGQAIYL